MPVERISKEQLKERLDRGDKPTILDVRLKYAYEHSTVKLPGAIRVPPYAIDSVAIPAGSVIRISAAGVGSNHRRRNGRRAVGAGGAARSGEGSIGRSLV